MKDFNALLMPFSFLRRWNYNELIPALLYFDRVTFLMDDIEPQYISNNLQESGAPQVRLKSPTELAGMNPDEFVDGLTVEQHKYYWPMRDLMKEEVIVISSTGMGPPIWPEARQQLQILLDQKERIALEYEIYSNEFYDFCMPIEQRKCSSIDKAMEVHSWINHALQWRPGWQRVTLHPNAYRALLSSLEVFPDLQNLYLRSQVDRSGRSIQTPAQSHLAMRVVGTLLEEKLNSFALEDDPNALSEILNVRQKYAADLQAFRSKMSEATNEWQMRDIELKYLPETIESYIQKVRPEFEHSRLMLTDKMRIPKLVLRKGGALIVIGAFAGIGAALGTAFAGPPGTVAGAAAGASVSAAIPEALKSFFTELGKEAANRSTPEPITVDKSLVYLFHAETAFKR